jgi:hypothetical protein
MLALMIAASRGCLESIEALLGKDDASCYRVATARVGAEGILVLMIAASRGCVESIEALLGKDYASCYLVGTARVGAEGMLALVIAASRGCVESKKPLLGGSDSRVSVIVMQYVVISTRPAARRWLRDEVLLIAASRDCVESTEVLLVEWSCSCNFVETSVTKKLWALYVGCKSVHKVLVAVALGADDHASRGCVKSTEALLGLFLLLEPPGGSREAGSWLHPFCPNTATNVVLAVWLTRLLLLLLLLLFLNFLQLLVPALRSLTRTKATLPRSPPTGATWRQL